MTIESYEAWFSRKVQEALDDKNPGIPHEEAMNLVGAKVNEALKRQIEGETR